MGSNQAYANHESNRVVQMLLYANASRIELGIANVIMRVNKKTANWESICELRPKKTQFLDFFVKSRKGPKNSGLKKTKINAQFSVGVASMRFPPPYVTPANLSSQVKIGSVASLSPTPAACAGRRRCQCSLLIRCCRDSRRKRLFALLSDSPLFPLSSTPPHKPLFPLLMFPPRPPPPPVCAHSSIGPVIENTTFSLYYTFPIATQKPAPTL